MGNPALEIFKAYDIRGIVDHTLTETTVQQIGHAVASDTLACQSDTVIVGRDGRLSGPRLVSALCDGIRAGGGDVVDIGMVATPCTYFASHHLNIGSAISVTGSHNPPEYNGLKIMVDGETLFGERIQRLRQRIETGELEHGNGNYRQTDIVEDYLNRITNTIELERPLKIVTDCGNGVAGALVPRLFRALGCEVIDLYSTVDGTFPNHHPDPIRPENLTDLIATVQREGAEFGLAFDGDGDRLGVVSPDGRIIWPDRQLILFARDVLIRHPNAEIIFDVKCTQLLRQTILESGGIPTMWKTGHSLIKAKLRESGAPLAGEMSGHIFFNDRWYGFDDALYVGARLCELLAKEKVSPETIFRELPDTLNTPELRLEMTEGAHHDLIHQLVANAHFSDGTVSHIDGIRVDFEDGFGLARASNTTPTVIFRFEATSEKKLDQIKSLFRDQLLSLEDDLDLPF